MIFSGIVLLLAGSISSTYAQTPTVDFRGTWNTVTGKGKKIVINFETVRRTSVTGTYARNGLTGTASYKPVDDTAIAFVKVSAVSGEPALQSISSITGTVTGNVLRFKWLEDGGRGAGRFTMSSDFQSFQGTYSRTDNPDDTSGGTWNGTRAPIFHGVWQTESGGKIVFPQVLFQQTGSQVVGQFVRRHPPARCFQGRRHRRQHTAFQGYASPTPDLWANSTRHPHGYRRIGYESRW